MNKPSEWTRNNSTALQALICGKNPADFVRESSEPCTMTEAAGICGVNVFTLRRYSFGCFPDIYKMLGLPPLPPVDSFTQFFDKEELKEWAGKFKEIRAKAEALAPKRPKTTPKKTPKITKAEAQGKQWVKLSDLATAARIKKATLWDWTRKGIPKRYAEAGEFPTPSFRTKNVAFYESSALEWAKRLGEIVDKEGQKERIRRRLIAQAVDMPVLIGRSELASMIGITVPALAMWCTKGIPKELKALGCPEVPKTIYGSFNRAFHYPHEVTPWVLAYKQAKAKQQAIREEKQKARNARQAARNKSKKPRKESAWYPDVSDLGFEVVCEADAALMLDVSKLTVNRMSNRGISRKMKSDGVPDFPAVVCTRKRFKFFKKSEVEAWGETFRKIYPKVGEKL